MNDIFLKEWKGVGRKRAMYEKDRIINVKGVKGVESNGRDRKGAGINEKK